MDQQQQYQYRYSQAPMQPAPLSQMVPVKAPPVHVSSKGMWSSKLSLRIIIVQFDIIMVGLAGSLVANYDVGPIILFGPPAGVSFIWSIAEAICICARGGHRGIHPGACVGVDLIIWLGFIASSVIYGLLGYTNAYYDDYYYGYYSRSSAYSQTHANAARAALAFAVIVLLMHFTLFIIACVETNQRNSQSRVIYVPANSVPMQPVSYPQAAMPTTYQPAYMPQQMMPPQQYQQQQQQQQQQRQSSYVKPEEGLETVVTTSPMAPSPVHGGMR